MIRIILLSLLLASSAFAYELPEYARVKYPSCSCSCEGRLIFKSLASTETNLLNWSQEAIRVSFEYGFGNYKTALENASQYFTRSGWDGFIEELVKSNNLDIMLEKKLVANVKFTDEPKIVKSIQSNHLSGWEIEIPIVANYSNSKISINKSLLVTLEVVQTEKDNRLQGLAIQQFIIAPDPMS